MTTAKIKQAMILAAGRGSRLSPLTDSVPKPLIPVGSTPPLLRHLSALAAAGIQRVVINLHHLGEQIKQAAGDGSAYGITIHYSPEPKLLSAAGGIRWALAQGLLDPATPFLVVNGDILCDIDFATIPPPPEAGCHLLLTSNPPENPAGDFSLTGSTLALPGEQTQTYTGIGSYDPKMFAPLPAGDPSDLLPLLQTAIKQDKATAQLHTGIWHDIGTPAALAAARKASPPDSLR